MPNYNDYSNMESYGVPNQFANLFPSTQTNFQAGSQLFQPPTNGLSGFGMGAGPSAGSNSIQGFAVPDTSYYNSPAEKGGWNFLNTPGQQGWGGLALGGAGALATAFMGMKQYGLAKESLAQNKLQFDTQFGAQKQLTNSRMGDRQLARVASNPGAYESVGSYMNQNGVK